MGQATRTASVSVVLRLPRPRRECLARTLETASAEQFRESEGGVPLSLARHDNERRQDRLRFLEAHVDLPTQAAVPAEGGTRVALRRFVSNQQAELESFCQPDVQELSDG